MEELRGPEALCLRQTRGRAGEWGDCESAKRSAGAKDEPRANEASKKAAGEAQRHFLSVGGLRRRPESLSHWVIESLGH